MSYLRKHAGREMIEETISAAGRDKIPTFKFLVKNNTTGFVINPNEVIQLKRTLSFRMHHFISGIFLSVVGFLIFTSHLHYFIIGIMVIIGVSIWL